jgi:hypothetical protein
MLLILLSLPVAAIGAGDGVWPNEQSSVPTRRVNAPYNVTTNQSAILWFGQLDYTSNHTNVRVSYNDQELIVFAHIFDRYIWFDPSAVEAELTRWDAVSLYLNLTGNAGDSPTQSAYHFVVQFNPSQRSRTNSQLAYQGTGNGWAAVPLAFTTDAGYRGTGYNNGAPAHGWWAKFAVPFASLGLSAPPAAGSTWGLAVAVHDRDDAVGTPIPDKIWPEMAVDLQPATWGQLGFGLTNYVPLPARPLGTVTIRQGVNDNIVMDGHVGGHSLCGSNVGSWLEWAQANYAGHKQVNIQNQWDVADWPCFSKYYVTFPLDDIPAGRIILSAKLTLFQFGGAGQRSEPEPEPSFIQVLTVAEDWNETQLNWNNAPLALENLIGAWANPLPLGYKWPGIPIEWDVSGAVAEAYAAGQPLRLALYSADTAYHSGRYFYSSDADEEGRPLLEITWGEPFAPTSWSYVPYIQFE